MYRLKKKRMRRKTDDLFLCGWISLLKNMNQNWRRNPIMRVPVCGLIMISAGIL